MDNNVVPQRPITPQKKQRIARGTIFIALLVKSQSKSVAQKIRNRKLWVDPHVKIIPSMYETEGAAPNVI